MEEFLNQANLSDLIDVLKENDVNDLEILGELIAHPDELKTIITSLGLRMALQKKYKDHIQANNTIETLLCDILNPGINLIQTPPEIVTENNVQSDASTSTSDQVQELTCLPLVNNTQNDHNQEESSLKKRKRISDSGINFDLKEVLDGHPIGQALHRIGSYQKSFVPAHQSLLADIIGWELLRIDRPVTNADHLQIAQQIVHHFPGECIETYFVQPVKKKDSKRSVSEISKGKLPDKYRNLRGIIRKAAHIGKVPTLSSVDREQTEEYIEADKSKLWLVHNREASEVLHHWDTSYTLRMSDIEDKKYVNVQDIFNIWPILREAKSFELIERDFAKKFPDSQNLFILEWDNFFPNLLKLYKQKLAEQDLIYTELLKKDTELQPGDDNKLHPDSKTLIQFHLLASLMAPKANKIKNKDSTGKLTFWKPTIAESREGIILQVKIPGDIERIIDEKRSRMLEKGLSLQPHIIAIGKDLTDVQKAYVRIDSVSYELPSLLKAIDVLFKVYLVFNLRYPLECENFCYLIQWGLYKIRTKSDVQIPLVFNTLNQLKRQNKQ